MPLQRCPQCKVLTLVEEDVRSGLCPECGTSLPGLTPVLAQQPAPVANPPHRRVGLWFAVGLMLGVAATGSSAAAWWIWGREVTGGPTVVHPVAAEVGLATDADPRDTAAGPEPISYERLWQALADTELAECRRSALEGDLAETLARSRSEVATVEQKLDAMRQQLAQARERATAAEKALGKKQADAAAEKGLAAKQGDAANEMRAAQIQRVAMEGQLAAARARLQETREQVVSTERALEMRKAEVAAAEKAIAMKKNETAALDRSLEGKRNQAAALDRALEAKKAETAAADKALETRKAQLVALANGRTNPPPTTVNAAVTAAPKQGRLPSPHAFVRQWRVVGPFPNEERKKGHAMVFPPEKEPVELGKDYTTLKGPARWHTFPSPGDYVDFANYFNGQPARTELGYYDPGVAYAVCWVRSASTRPALISLGSNDGVKLWINRREYLDRPVERAAAPDQERVPCELAAGWNEILVKVDNQGGGWGFYLELREPNGGRPLEGLEFRTKPPEGAAKR